MSKPIIAIDVDDVLADNAAGFVAFSNERWGTNLLPEDYDEHWAKLWGMEHDLDETARRRDQFVTSRIYRHYKPVDQAREVLKRLSKTYELRIATSRLATMKDDTFEWLHEHYEGIFNENTIHLAGIWDNVTQNTHTLTKADLVKLINADYLIDDQLKHCEAVAGNGGTALLFGNYGWNQSQELPKNVIRVEDWLAVEKYFDNELRK